MKKFILIIPLLLICHLANAGYIEKVKSAYSFLPVLDGVYLNLSGSNANQNINIGSYSLSAGTLYATDSGTSDFTGGIRVGSTNQASIDASGSILTTGPLGAGVTTITGSNTALFKVGSTPTFQVDTVNGTLGIETSPTSSATIESVQLSGKTAFRILNTITGSGSSLNLQGLSYAPTINGNFTSGTIYAFNSTPSMIGTYTTSLDVRGINLYFQTGGEAQANSVTTLTGGIFGVQDYTAVTGTGNPSLNLKGMEITTVQDLGISKTGGSLATTIQGLYMDTRLDDSTYDKGTITGDLYGIRSMIFASLGDGFGTNECAWQPVVYNFYAQTNFGDTRFAAYNLTCYSFFIEDPSVSSNAGTMTHWGFYNSSTQGHNLLGKDNVKTYFGTGLDLALYHDGTNSWIENDTGILKIYDKNNGGIWLGTANTEKVGFYGTTAVVQGAATTDLGTILSNVGLRAAGTAYTLTTTGAVDVGAFRCDSITNDTGLASGVYTPTLYNTTNISASTAYECQYMRVGSVVTVSGHVNIDVTTGGSDAQLDMTLPVASDFATSGQAAGVATTDGSQDLFTIYADATNNRVSFYSKANGLTTNSAYYFTFTYKVI